MWEFFLGLGIGLTTALIVGLSVGLSLGVKSALAVTLWDILAYSAPILFCFSEISPYIQWISKRTWKWDAKNRPTRIPPSVFKVMWNIINGLTAAAWISLVTVVLAHTNDNSNSLYIASYVLIFVFVLFRQLWVVSIGDYQSERWALVILILMDAVHLTNLSVLFAAYAQEDTGNHYTLLPIMLLGIVPTIWLLMATGWNWSYVTNGQHMTYYLDTKEKDETPEKSETETLASKIAGRVVPVPTVGHRLVK